MNRIWLKGSTGLMVKVSASQSKDPASQSKDPASQSKDHRFKPHIGHNNVSWHYIRTGWFLEANLGVI